MSDAPAIVDVMALSPLQQGLYSLAGLTDGGTDPYFIAMAADVDGALDTALLRRCAEAMLQRHPNVRVSFFQGNLSRPVAVVPATFDLLHQPYRAQAMAPSCELMTRLRDLGHAALISGAGPTVLTLANGAEHAGRVAAAIEEIAAAYRRVDSGRKVGNVLIRP